MSEFKGTKGKWKTYNSDDDSVTIVKEDESQAIAFLPELFEESEANAKLIAAAPEMLKMLIKLNNFCTMKVEDRNELEELIKKSTE